MTTIECNPDVDDDADRTETYTPPPQDITDDSNTSAMENQTKECRPMSTH
jgi:hypothetical protein